MTTRLDVEKNVNIGSIASSLEGINNSLSEILMIIKEMRAEEIETMKRIDARRKEEAWLQRLVALQIISGLYLVIS